MCFDGLSITDNELWYHWVRNDHIDNVYAVRRRTVGATLFALVDPATDRAETLADRYSQYSHNSSEKLKADFDRIIFNSINK